MAKLLDDRAAATATTRADWRDLEEELDRWAHMNRAATLWWRDDDAATATPALDRLLALADATPLALAAIPAAASPALATLIAARAAGGGTVTVLQHGWAHANHAPDGSRNMELGTHRPTETVLAELAAGRARLADLCGAAFRAVLTPPWNRIADAVAGRLGEIGFRGLSTLGPRRAAERAPGVVQVNVHADVIDWRRDRRFVGTGSALGHLVAHLAARRTGAADPAEPTGILTHHLVQDEATDRFVARLLAATRGHAAARWVTVDEAFGFAP
jgi:hypothetical protein